MRGRGIRLHSAGVAVLCLISIFPWISLAAAAQTVQTLNGAQVRLIRGENLIYNGSERTPTVEVITSEGVILTENVDYTLQYRNNRNAGQATVEAIGMGMYTGSCSGSFSIDPRPLRPEEIQITGGYLKPYDGSRNANPVLTVTALPGDAVTVSYSQAVYDDPYVGAQKSITVSGLSLERGGNYCLDDPTMTVTKDQGQITPVAFQCQSPGQLPRGGAVLDLMELLPGIQKGSAQFSFDSDALDASLNGSTLISGEEIGSVSLVVQVENGDVNGDGQPEYMGGQDRLTVSIVDKAEQPPLDVTGDQSSLTLTGSESVTYGQTLQFGTVGGQGSGKVTYTVTGLTGKAVIDSSGLLTPIKAGTVLVTASKAGDAHYHDAISQGVVVTIYRAELTITVHDQSARVGDALPSLSAEAYTVSGLVGEDRLSVLPTLSYQPVPNMTQAGRVNIQAAGAVVPIGGNYVPTIRYVPGTLTISALPLYTITVESAAHGILTVDRTTAVAGTVVTVRAKAAEGYQLKEAKAALTSGGKQRLTETGADVFTFVMPSGPVTVSGTFEAVTVPKPGIPFTDVKETDWFYSAVAYVFEKGLMNGTGERTFSPERSITRGMIVTVLYRMEGSPAVAGWSPFGDVKPGLYYAGPVSWAAWNGIVNGYDAARFGPEDPITREQLAAILYRYAGFKQDDISARGNLTQFSDVTHIHSYAWDALSWAVGKGLVNGKGNGVLDPAGLATRAQAAALLQRFCEEM